ncbi:hypothetical protein C8R43DRAFT_1129236 [Mycena crocata]|nr:hypothetical protein C8R43DRAFT_1129236 [Mycena crocata]
MSTARNFGDLQLGFGDLQLGERYYNMDYMVSEALLSKLILVYDSCFQLHLPTQQTPSDAASANDNDYDDLPDLEPAVTIRIDFSWVKRRKQLPVYAKL